MKFLHGLTVAMLVCGGALFTACNGSKEHTDTVPADTVTPPTTSPATPGSAVDTATAANAAWMMTDGNILAAMGMADSSEIAQAKLAQTKSKNAEVKKFAAMMITDHTKMMNEGKALGAKLSLAVEPPAGDSAAADMATAMQKLQSAAAGADFDSKYVAQAVEDHQKVLSKLNQLRGVAKNAEVQAAIDKAIPVVGQHLQHAQDMMNKMGGGSTAASDTAHRM